eukprot:9246392-Pyramimonas_sp.AAC.1
MLRRDMARTPRETEAGCNCGSAAGILDRVSRARAAAICMAALRGRHFAMGAGADMSMFAR